MAKGKYISVGQIPKLQTLYSQYAATVFDPKKLAVEGVEREERLAWASFHAGRKIESFKQLTRAEASELIDILLRNLRLPVTPPDRSKKRKSREAAHAAGTAGRRNVKERELQLVSSDDLAAIDELLQDLAWDRARLDAWLRSPSSPLGRKANPEIRTLADANKVRWALKRIRARQEKKVG